MGFRAKSEDVWSLCKYVDYVYAYFSNINLLTYVLKYVHKVGDQPHQGVQGQVRVCLEPVQGHWLHACMFLT